MMPHDEYGNEFLLGTVMEGVSANDSILDLHQAGGVEMPEDVVEKKIRRRGGKFEVTNEAGTRVLGRHDTREGAQRQLAAIEASKRRRNKADEEKPLAEKGAWTPGGGSSGRRKKKKRRTSR